MITGNEPINPKISSDYSYTNGTTECSYTKINQSGGLTIRQYFAAMAMQGLLSNPEFLSNHKNIDIHILSVKNADYLISELNKPYSE